MKRKYIIEVGAETFECELEATTVSEEEKETYRNAGAEVIPDFTFDANDMQMANRQLALSFVSEGSDRISPAKLNFIINATGLRGSEIADYLEIDRASISQWRKDTPLSKAAWTACRLLFWDVLEHGSVTLPPLLERKTKMSDNKEKVLFRLIKTA